MECAGGCIDVTSDNANCGGCNAPCTGIQSCYHLVCTDVPAAMPTPRSASAALTGPDGRIYVIGGFDGNGTSYSTVEIYAPSTNTWTTGMPMPTPRDGFSAAITPAGLIYAIGGSTGQTGMAALSTVEIYDTKLDKWTPGASMLTARSGLAAARGSDGRIYAIGGSDANFNNLGVVEAYDPSSNTWTAAPSLPFATDYLSAAVGPDGRIYVVCANVFLSYEPGMAQWTVMAPLPDPQYDPTAVTGPDGLVYVFGGYSGLMKAFDTSAKTWTYPLPGLNTVREYAAGTLGKDGRIYAIGGFHGVVLNTVETFVPGGDWIP